MPHKPRGVIRCGPALLNAWRAILGAARGIPAWRTNPGFGVGGELLSGSYRFEGGGWRGGGTRVRFCGSRARLKRGARLLRRNYSLLREYLIPFREDSQRHGKVGVSENKVLTVGFWRSKRLVSGSCEPK